MNSTDPILKKGDKVSFQLYTYPYETVIGTITKVNSKPKQEHLIAIYEIEVNHPNMPTGKTTRFHVNVQLEGEK